MGKCFGKYIFEKEKKKWEEIIAINMRETGHWMELPVSATVVLFVSLT